MRRSMMASLIAIGGLLLAITQMGRRRNRRSYWGNFMHNVSNSMHDLLRSSNHMMRSFRKRARI